MRKQPNKKLVGIFLLGGIIALLLILMTSLGLWSRDANKNMYVLYFHESIKGLSVGAPVVLNGVEVGKVAKIEIVPNLTLKNFDIPVFITFNDVDKIVSLTPGRDDDLDEETIVKTMVENGLHAKLVNQNLLTGQLIIELDMRPAKSVTYGGPQLDGIYEIPTVLSPLTEISANVQDIPLKEVVENLNTTLNELKDVISPAAKISKDLSRKSATTLDNFNQAVQDVSRAANSLRNLADFLEQHPESLIRGR